MTAHESSATTALTHADPMPTTSEEGFLRRYNDKPQDTAVGRRLLTEAQLVADSDAVVWGAAA